MQAILIKTLEYLLPKLLAWAWSRFQDHLKYEKNKEIAENSKRENDRAKAANDIQDIFN